MPLQQTQLILKLLSSVHVQPEYSSDGNAILLLVCGRQNIRSGGTQMLRCTHAWTSLLKLTPKHILSFHAKNTPKQGCFCYFIPNLTSRRVWALKAFKSAFTKLHLFLKKDIFRSSRFKKRLDFSWKKPHFQTPKHEACFTCRTEKRPPFTCFFCSRMCTPVYLSGPHPPPPPPGKTSFYLLAWMLCVRFTELSCSSFL